MSFEEDWADLVSALVQGTDSGAVKWERDPLRPAAFRAPFAAGEVRLASVDDDGMSPFELDIYKANEYVEGVTGRTDRRLNNDFSALYPLVERQVSGASEVLRDLINELRSRL